MPPEPLDMSTGMPRPEIEAKVALAKAEVREETRRELAGIGKELQAIRDHANDADRKLVDLQRGQTQISGDVEVVRGDLAAVKVDISAVRKDIGDVLSAVKSLESQTLTIEEETADGRKIVKHFQNWGCVRDDVKKFWPHVVGGFIFWKAAGGWLAEHGITWATIWGAHK